MKKNKVYQLINEMVENKLNSIENLTDSTNLLTEANTALQSDKEFRWFTKTLSDREKDENIEILTKLLNRHIANMNNVKNKFVKIIKSFIPTKISGKYVFLYQLKSFDSIVDKSIFRNKSIFDIGDLIRGALIFKSIDQLTEFVKDFRRKAAPYITKYEFKSKGQDKNFGYYGTHHFDLHIDGFDTELIVSTTKLWNYKEEAHKIYTKWRSNMANVPDIDKNLSKQLFNMGNK